MDVLDCPLGSNIGRDVFARRFPRLDLIPIVGMLALTAVVTAAEGQNDWQLKVILKANAERVWVVVVGTPENWDGDKADRQGETRNPRSGCQGRSQGYAGSLALGLVAFDREGDEATR